ncbi:glycosyltransferase [Vibrio sp. AH4]|uniref:glycosyltransferase n=1 Tax=Vibrio sp. AH4 TaxID=2919577 RepID=UPI0027382F62|nr:glycosyltransferase [Vibrio sp. AH4]MDP4491811.1 glycosyltransferase [Vibrio sp. AH4]
MNILHVYRTCYPVTNGGVEQVMRYLSKGAIELGHNVKILSLSDVDDAFEFEGTQIHLCKRNFSIKSNCFSFSFYKEFKKLSDWADIINLHYPWPSGDFVSFLTNKPIVVTYHSDILRQKLLGIMYKPLEKYTLSKSKKIIATSQNYFESSNNLQKYIDKVEVIPLGINFDDYDSVDKDVMLNITQEYGKDFFLFLGVLRYYKGLDYLLEAAKDNHLPVVIAGSGPEEIKLKQYVAQHNLVNVKFAGFVSDNEKIALLSNCKGLVFPSHLRTEAFGVSIIEALYLGVPVISCDISTGTSYVNKNNETGYVIPPEDSDALSHAMIRLINCTDYDNMSKSCHRRALDFFEYRRMSLSYIEIYDKLLER